MMMTISDGFYIVYVEKTRLDNLRIKKSKSEIWISIFRLNWINQQSQTFAVGNSVYPAVSSSCCDDPNALNRLSLLHVSRNDHKTVSRIIKQRRYRFQKMWHYLFQGRQSAQNQMSTLLFFFFFFLYNLPLLLLNPSCRHRRCWCAPDDESTLLGSPQRGPRPYIFRRTPFIIQTVEMDSFLNII
jgi:hypothetical protein